MSDISVMQPINMTVLLSVLTASLAAMGTLIKIFGKRQKTEEEFKSERNDHLDIEKKIGQSVVCEEHKKTMARVENEQKDSKSKLEDLKDLVFKTKEEVAILKNNELHLSKTVEEMKDSSKKMAEKIEGLLQKLLDWMSSVE